MTVKELIKQLEKHNQNFEVILQSDSEGNGYSPLEGVDITNYVAESSYSGYCVNDDELDEYDPEAKSQLVVVCGPYAEIYYVVRAK